MTFAEAVAEITRRRDREWETKVETTPIYGKRGRILFGNPELHKSVAIAEFSLNEVLRILAQVDDR